MTLADRLMDKMEAEDLAAIAARQDPRVVALRARQAAQRRDAQAAAARDAKRFHGGAMTEAEAESLERLAQLLAQ